MERPPQKSEHPGFDLIKQTIRPQGMFEFRAVYHEKIAGIGYHQILRIKRIKANKDLVWDITSCGGDTVPTEGDIHHTSLKPMNANDGILMKMCFKLSLFSRGVILWRTIFFGDFFPFCLFFSLFSGKEGRKE